MLAVWCGSTSLSTKQNTKQLPFESAQLEGSAAWEAAQLPVERARLPFESVCSTGRLCCLGSSKKGRPGPPPFLICAKSVTNEAFLVKIHIRNCPGFKICLWKLPTGPAQLGGSPAAQLGKPRSTGARRSTGKKKPPPPPAQPSTAASQPAQPSPAAEYHTMQQASASPRSRMLAVWCGSTSQYQAEYQAASV